MAVWTTRLWVVALLAAAVWSAGVMGAEGTWRERMSGLHPSVRECLVELPPELLDAGPDVPETRNAYALWARGAAVFEPMPADLRAAVDKAGPSGLPKRERARFAEWRSRNKPAWDLFVRGAALKALRRPYRGLMDPLDPPPPPIKSLLDLSDFALLDALSSGSRDQVVEELLRRLGAARLLIEDRACVEDWLDGVALERTVVHDIQRNLLPGELPLDAAVAILVRLGEAEPLDAALTRALAGSFRAQFLSGLDFLARNNAEGGYENDLLKSLRNAARARLKGADKIAALEALSQGLLDTRETLRLAGALFERGRADALAPWPRRDRGMDEMAAACDAWAEAAGAKAALEPVLRRMEEGQMSAEDLAAIRAAIRNIAGKRLAGMMKDCYYLPKAALARAMLRREVLKAQVAIKAFAGRRGEPPQRLQELVDGMFLASVPQDPFGGGPLRYSRERMLLWSVGPDEKDDGGLDAPLDDLRVSSNLEDPGLKDFVWRAPAR
ncbi:MAG TPA: hypothetical protein P5137_04920 [Candidatus Brocadiia bacterium]|mgnify:CR=1 FL=1|nr:hypothetical protein [Candidatus Brocadiia bacterium]